MNEEVVKEDDCREEETNKFNNSSDLNASNKTDSNATSSVTLSTNITFSSNTNESLQENSIYNHLSNGKGDGSKIKGKISGNNNRNLF